MGLPLNQTGGPSTGATASGGGGGTSTTSTALPAQPHVLRNNDDLVHRDNNNNDDDLHKPSQQVDQPNTNTTSAALLSSSSLSTYVSLIQQYLSVFMVDNATFLAERCVAEHPTSSDATYLLALCYYRSGSPKRARLILERYPHNSSATGRETTASSTSNTSSLPATTGAATNNNSISASMRYLSSQCSYELKDYSRAEDALLHDCRKQYHKYRGDLTLDEWIIQTTPCPIPNGAAGLALLGKICRKSNRVDRAITYFQLSLQLDPFLWASFEALAELGAPNLNPGMIFGIESTRIATNGDDSSATMADPTTDLATNHHPTSFVHTAATPGINTNILGSNNALQPVATPVASSLNNNNLMFTAANAQPSPSFVANVLPPASSSNARHRERTLVDTPGLTPIPLQSSFLHYHQMTPPPPLQHHALASTPPPPPSTTSAIATQRHHPMVVRRARDVASRQYYPPSPETPHTMAHVTRSLKYLKGLGSTTTHHGNQSLDEDFNNGGSTRTASHHGAANYGVQSGGGGGVRSLFGSTENQARHPNQTSVSTPAFLTTPTTVHAAPEQPIDDDNKGGVGGGDKRDHVVHPVPQQQHSGGVTNVLELLCVMGAAYQRLCLYRCRDALRILSALPPSHQATGWVLHQQGRAYLELNLFQDAKRSLELLQSNDPGRIKGLELLSTVYWQLKKEVELAYLSQRVIDMDRLAPEAWCVVGNCFSLQKDHESALVFFKRSLQLEYDFTYTHTLCGYEYMANEDFDKAIACFRQALRIDERHYNAWYGLGAIYHRQEQYDMAEYHFGKAVEINPSSSVLRCNLGIAQNANGKPYQALDTLAGAFQLDPRNPQARFQRATIYSALNRPEEALEELRKVRDAAPREATIHFAMGKVLKRLGRQEEAMKCFLTAMDLDPKENQMIKSAMDKLDEPDVDEEAMSTF